MVLRKPADQGRHGILDARRGSRNREQVSYGCHHRRSAALVERRIGDRIIERVVKRIALIANQPNVRAKTEAVVSPYPRQIIRKVVNGSYAGYGTLKPAR